MFLAYLYIVLHHWPESDSDEYQSVITEGYGDFLRFLILYIAMMIIYELHVAANTRQVLSLATQMHEQQGMYNTITENLDEGIIVK